MGLRMHTFSNIMLEHNKQMMKFAFCCFSTSLISLISSGDLTEFVYSSSTKVRHWHAGMIFSVFISDNSDMYARSMLHKQRKRKR